MNIPQILVDNLNKEDYQLLQTWCEASKAYYDTDSNEEPMMSDAAFDDLQNKLLEIDDYDTDVINALQVFIKSGIYRNGEIQHEHYEQEMISLFKIHYGEENNQRYLNQCISEINNFFRLDNKLFKTLLINNEVYFAPKFDGCSLKITWEFTDNIGRLKQIITRGGIDVTNLLCNVPGIIQTKYFGCTMICGELLIEKQTFENKYSIDSNNDKYQYANPRNFVGSLVKRNEIEQEIIRDLRFVPCTDGIDPLLESNVWHHLNDDILDNLWEYMDNLRKNYSFLCDGIVLATLSDNHIRKVKDNYPLNMVAIKFPNVKARTTVIGYEWSQKKSGKLTPRLKVKPVKLDGSIINYVNGYNIQTCVELGTGVDSVIEITKSGDIIPVVAKVIWRSNKIKLPDCKFVRRGRHLIAVEEDQTKIFKFISAIKHLQLQGIGDVIAERIGNVVNFKILDVFNPENKRLFLEEFGGDTTTANWRNFIEIYNIKTIYLNDLIMLLQFDGVGVKSAERIAQILTKQSTSISGLSSDALSVMRGENYLKIQEAIKTLASYGIKILKPLQVNEDTITYEMSGNPPSMTKGDFEKLMKNRYPNSVHTSLTKSTNILFVDSIGSNTSKVLKARKYNIKIVEYKQIINGGSI